MNLTLSFESCHMIPYFCKGETGPIIICILSVQQCITTSMAKFMITFLVLFITDSVRIINMHHLYNMQCFADISSFTYPKYFLGYINFDCKFKSMKSIIFPHMESVRTNMHHLYNMQYFAYISFLTYVANIF